MSTFKVKFADPEVITPEIIEIEAGEMEVNDNGDLIIREDNIAGNIIRVFASGHWLSALKGS